MNFQNSIRLIERSLDSNTILVSDALISLIKLLELRTASHELLSGRRDSYAPIVELFKNELLGYDVPNWDLEKHYRRCSAQLIKRFRSESTPYAILSNTRFVMVLGASQIESQLAMELDLDVLGSGCDVTIGAELEALHTKDVMLYTDSGISEELWLRFSIMEMVKVYFDMKKLVIDLCKIAIEIAESNAKDSLNGVSAHAVQRFSRKTYEAISDVITYGDHVPAPQPVPTQTQRSRGLTAAEAFTYPKTSQIFPV